MLSLFVGPMTFFVSMSSSVSFLVLGAGNSQPRCCGAALAGDAATPRMHFRPEKELYPSLYMRAVQPGKLAAGGILVVLPLTDRLSS